MWTAIAGPVIGAMAILAAVIIACRVRARAKLEIESAEIARQSEKRPGASPGELDATEQPRGSRHALGISDEGIKDILRRHILLRTLEQLDPAVRAYEHMEDVERGCSQVAERIRQDGFHPDVVVGWKDAGNLYQGSEVIAEYLAKELGTPSRLVLLKERGEERVVAEDCTWFKGKDAALVVTDACYSGATQRIISDALVRVNPKADIRLAVLSARSSEATRKLYFASMHSTSALLFPWGWSRLIVSLYQVYEVFGIEDRITIWSEDHEWGRTRTLAREFQGAVALLDLEPGSKREVKPRVRVDAFLYVMSGRVTVRIADATAVFEEGQHLFIPRGIEFSLTTDRISRILELTSGDLDGLRTESPSRTV